MRQSWGAMVLGAGLLLMPQASSAAVDATVAAAMKLTDGGKAPQAYALLMPLLTTRTGDPDFNYALGVAALDSGRPSEALLAFQRALAIQPNYPQARAEIARTYAALGDVDTARREFNTVAGDPTIPDPVRQRFNKIVRDLDAVARPGLNISGYAEAAVGYDGNVNAATSDSALTIPLFAFLGPATLSPAATRQDDGYAALQAGISAQYGLSRRAKVFGSLLGSAHGNFSENDFDQTFAAASAGYAYTLANRDVSSISVQSQQFWIAGNRYRAANGIVGQFTRPMSGNRAVSVSAQYFDVTYPTDRLRDADRYAIGVNFSGPTVFVGLQGGQEDARAVASRYLSNSFYGARLAFDRPLTPRVSVFASVATERRQYSDTDPLFLIRRQDTESDLGLGLRFRVAQRVSVTPQVTYTHNASNIVLDAYDRFTGSLALRTEF